MMKEPLKSYSSKLPGNVIEKLKADAKAKKDSRNHILILILKKHYGLK